MGHANKGLHMKKRQLLAFVDFAQIASDVWFMITICCLLDKNIRNNDNTSDNNCVQSLNA